MQAGNYDLVVLQDVHVIFGEDGETVVVTEFLSIEMSELVVMSLTMWADCALEESLLGNCRVLG